MHAIVQDVPAEQKASMLVVSEFVGCSPSLSGAIRVNPWNVDSVADGIYSAIKMPLPDRHLRHAKHWRYVSTHTAAFWVKVSCPLIATVWDAAWALVCPEGLCVFDYGSSAFEDRWRENAKHMPFVAAELPHMFP